MDRISRTELLDLSAPAKGPRVSVYLPLVRTYPHTEQNPIRLRDALDEAARKLEASGMRARDAKRFLEPARSVSAGEELVQLDSTSGLALLVEEGRQRSYFLPYSCPATVDVGANFYLAPLMRLLVWPLDFLLLTLSGNAVHLSRCTRKESVAVELPPSAPKSLEDFLQGTESGPPVRFQTAAGTGPTGPAIDIVHGGTSYKDDAHDRLHEYVRTVAKHVAALSEKEGLPLVLAAVREVHATFREAYSGRNLIEAGIQGSPDELGSSEMRFRGASLVESTHAGEVKSALEKYHRAAETGSACDPLTIVAAAAGGRIDSVIAAFGERLWGTWDPSAQRAEVAADQSNQLEKVDLVDLALVETLRHGGHVCVVPRGDVPGHSVMAAVYRW